MNKIINQICIFYAYYISIQPATSAEDILSFACSNMDLCTTTTVQKQNGTATNLHIQCDPYKTKPAAKRTPTYALQQCIRNVYFFFLFIIFPSFSPIIFINLKITIKWKFYSYNCINHDKRASVHY